MFYCDYYYQNPYIIIWIGYVLIPICDYFLPVDHTNLPESRIKAFEKDYRFDLPVYLAWAIDVGVFFLLLHLVSVGKIAQTPVSFLIYAVTYAHIGVVNASVGHELIHRRGLVPKIIGSLAYSKMLYSHFHILHLHTHHKRVATLEDP